MNSNVATAMLYFMRIDCRVDRQNSGCRVCHLSVPKGIMRGFKGSSCGLMRSFLRQANDVHVMGWLNVKVAQGIQQGAQAQSGCLQSA